MLTGDEWSALARHLVPLQAAQARGASDVVVALSGLRKASLFAGKNGLLLDVREWFDKDGEQKPGVKGLSLSSAELKAGTPCLCVTCAVSLSALRFCFQRPARNCSTDVRCLHNAFGAASLSEMIRTPCSQDGSILRACGGCISCPWSILARLI